jgi:hypothetical protein
VSAITFPHISQINERESLLFFSTEATPFPCVLCSRGYPDAPLVRSGGLRIDVFYLRGTAPTRHIGTLVSDPICWTCVRGKARGSKTSHKQWRAAAAQFLNALHESDPRTYYCGIQGLG